MRTWWWFSRGPTEAARRDGDARCPFECVTKEAEATAIAKWRSAPEPLEWLPGGAEPEAIVLLDGYETTARFPMAKSSKAGGWEVGRSIRSWHRAYAAAAKRDGYRTLLGQLGYAQGDPGSKGEELVAGLTEVVTFVLALRSMDGQLTQDGAEAFLGAQRYGVRPGAGLAVRLGPMPEVEVFVDELGDLDFEDLFNRFVFFDICVTRLHAEFTESAAASVVEHIRDDLSFDGDEYEIEWEHGGAWVNIHATEID